jgi:hypothetical protein
MNRRNRTVIKQREGKNNEKKGIKIKIKGG